MIGECIVPWTGAFVNAKSTQVEKTGEPHQKLPLLRQETRQNLTIKENTPKVTDFWGKGADAKQEVSGELCSSGGEPEGQGTK